MLFSFAKTARFHSRKLLQYHNRYADVTNTMMYPLPSLTVEPPRLDLAINMTSLTSKNDKI
jgi:hypothetical protein